MYEQNQTATEPKVLATIDGNSLMAQEYEPLQFSIDTILPHGIFIFAGSPKVGKARFASLRSTRDTFRMDCAGSDKRYGFAMASSLSDQLYLYESPIDAMSHASLENALKGDKNAWTGKNRLSLAGTSDAAIPFFLNQHKEIKELVFCLDNDSPGSVAANVLQRVYAEKGYYTRKEPPVGKDYNEDLLASIQQARSERQHKSKSEPCL
jgi:hypothetical protein